MQKKEACVIAKINVEILPSQLCFKSYRLVVTQSTTSLFMQVESRIVIISRCQIEVLYVNKITHYIQRIKWCGDICAHRTIDAHIHGNIDVCCNLNSCIIWLFLLYSIFITYLDRVNIIIILWPVSRDNWR